MKIELLKELLVTAIASGVVMTLFIQKIKESFTFRKSSYITLISVIVNMILGTLFALNFSNVSFVNALWVGFFSFIGADIIYKSLEDKIFKSLDVIKNEQEEEIDLDLSGK